jgi:hypothetical protein
MLWRKPQKYLSGLALDYLLSLDLLGKRDEQMHSKTHGCEISGLSAQAATSTVFVVVGICQFISIS